MWLYINVVQLDALSNVVALFDVQYFHKGEGCPKKPTFHRRLKQVNIELFDSPKFLPLKCPLSRRNFASREVTTEAAILKLSWQPARVHVTSFRPTRNWWEGEKLTWHPTQGHQQNLVFRSDYPLHYIQCYYS